MKTNEEYMNFFGSGVVRNFQIAEYVKKNSEPNDKIYVWGTEPAIYAMSDRLPSSKYTVAYHVVDFNGYAHTLEAIERDKPVFIVWFENESAEFKELAEYVSVNYVEVKKIGEAIVYRKTAW
jgi:sporulation protein YlmC with PRC-barrel domain